MRAYSSAINERAYLIARFLALFVVFVLMVVSSPWFADLDSIRYVEISFLVLLISTGGLLYARRTLRQPMEHILLWIAPFDYFVVGLLGYAFHEFEGGAYAMLMLLVVYYSLVLDRRAARLLSLVALFVYVSQHYTEMLDAPTMSLFFLTIKALLLVFISEIVSTTSAQRNERETEANKSRGEKEQLNRQLQQRLSELQAVSQVTEIIHSSLDFDRVGPMVLEVLTKVINVPACCLFVIDKHKAETLFSASVGMSDESVPVSSAAGYTGDYQIDDSHFSCSSIVDHRQMMVVFCADTAVADGMSAEDQLVLQAIASELVVAVENSQLYKLTKRLAITDELTDLYNYRYLQQRLDEEIERAKRYNKDLSLLMIDVDEFKGFNDRYGHIAGDRALNELGKVIKRSVREVDVVCRYGGEEFSVALPETDAAGAYVVAEKIRESVASFVFADADGERGAHLTVSLGLATFPSHAEDKEHLLKMADDALYQAKNSGKDRVKSPLLRPSPAH